MSNETYRATGRTFRAILGALLQASSGEKVNFVTRDVISAISAYKQAIQIIPFKTDESEHNRRIDFPNGGSVEFIGVKEKKSHSPEKTIVKDTE